MVLVRSNVFAQSPYGKYIYDPSKDLSLIISKVRENKLTIDIQNHKKTLESFIKIAASITQPIELYLKDTSSFEYREKYPKIYHLIRQYERSLSYTLRITIEDLIENIPASIHKIDATLDLFTVGLEKNERNDPSTSNFENFIEELIDIGLSIRDVKKSYSALLKVGEWAFSKKHYKEALSAYYNALNKVYFLNGSQREKIVKKIFYDIGSVFSAIDINNITLKESSYLTYNNNAGSISKLTDIDLYMYLSGTLRSTFNEIALFEYSRITTNENYSQFRLKMNQFMSFMTNIRFKINRERLYKDLAELSSMLDKIKSRAPYVIDIVSVHIGKILSLHGYTEDAFKYYYWGLQHCLSKNYIPFNILYELSNYFYIKGEYDLAFSYLNIWENLTTLNQTVDYDVEYILYKAHISLALKDTISSNNLLNRFIIITNEGLKQNKFLPLSRLKNAYNLKKIIFSNNQDSLKHYQTLLENLNSYSNLTLVTLLGIESFWLRKFTETEGLILLNKEEQIRKLIARNLSLSRDSVRQTLVSLENTKLLEQKTKQQYRLSEELRKKGDQARRLWTWGAIILSLLLIAIIILFLANRRKSKKLLDATTESALLRDGIQAHNLGKHYIKIANLLSAKKHDSAHRYASYNAEHFDKLNNTVLNQKISIAEEIELFKTFLKGESIIYTHDISVSYRYTNIDATKVLILPEIFTQLYQNAMDSAFVDQNQDYTFQISFSKHNDLIECEISNNGRGNPVISEFIKPGHYLDMTRNRLFHAFTLAEKTITKEDVMKIKSNELDGTSIKILLPYEEI